MCQGVIRGKVTAGPSESPNRIVADRNEPHVQPSPEFENSDADDRCRNPAQRHRLKNAFEHSGKNDRPAQSSTHRFGESAARSRDFVVDHCVDEAVRVEDGEVVDLFAEADVFDGQTHCLADGDDDSAFG